MYGRHRLSRRKQFLTEQFEGTPFDDDWEPRYNIAMTQAASVIRQHLKESRRLMSLMRYGLIPFAEDNFMPSVKQPYFG